MMRPSPGLADAGRASGSPRVRWRGHAGTGLTACAVLLVLAPTVIRAEVRAGAGQATIDLPPRVPLAGYSRRGGASATGVHDPVSVRAVVFEESGRTTALVSCDLLVIDERLAAAARRRLAEDGLGHVLLWLAATHTHSGPGAYGRRFLEKISMGHYDPRARAAILGAISRAVAGARRDLAPLSGAAYGVRQTEGLVQNRMDPAGPVARHLTLHALYHQGSATPFAVIAAFAAHPTTLGADNRKISADYPGVLAREVERRVPGAVCLFLAGAVADQAPVKQSDGFEAAERLGHALADAAVNWLSDAQVRPVHAVSAAVEVMKLDAPRVMVGRTHLPRWLGRLLVDDDASLSLLRVGGTVYVGAPCDVAAALGRRLEEAARAQGAQPVVAGFVNDYIGYCLPEDAAQQPSYEASMSFNGPRTGERVIHRLIELLRAP